MTKYYLTTPLYYVNDVPHIGHAYTTIAADVLARWKRLTGADVFFLTGTDEHGAKIAKAAEAAGKTPKDFVNGIVVEWKKAWETLGITNDDFIQTSDERHRRVVQWVFEELRKKGDIYKGSYEGWYCIHDETNFGDSEVTEGKCPSCGRPLERRAEESYFFKLNNYAERLLAHYEKHPEFLSPKFRANEIINFVKEGMKEKKDLSVSRTRVTWGVPIPSDPNHTVYVWFDALLNYVSAPGWKSGDPAAEARFKKFWPADVHLVGKEIFRFHTVIWPAMLMALDLPLPKKVFAHGWWTVEGTKMSKSLGNVVDPNKMVAEYGADAFRYFLLREVPFGSDGDFSEKALLGRYNAELANNLGNLLQRTTTLLEKNFGSEIPAASGKPALLTDLAEIAKKVSDQYDALAFGDVLETVFGVMVRTNQFIDEKAPWKIKLDAEPGRKAELGEILLECLRSLRVLAVILCPYMPWKCADIWTRLGETTPLEKDGARMFAAFLKGELPPFAGGQKTVKADPLFMRKGTKAP